MLTLRLLFALPFLLCHNLRSPGALQRIEMENSTVKIKFFLMGFSDHPELQDALIAMFLFIYSVMLMGKLRMKT